MGVLLEATQASWIEVLIQRQSTKRTEEEAKMGAYKKVEGRNIKFRLKKNTRSHKGDERLMPSGTYEPYSRNTLRT